MAISRNNVHGNYVFSITFSIKNRKDVFLDGTNALLMTNCILIGKTLEHYWLLAFVVMPDHVHLVLKPNKRTLSQCMQALKGASSSKINKNMDRTGELWQSEYHAKQINYLELLIREIEYIENNPVKDGLVKTPGDYLFSSYCIQPVLDSGKIDDMDFWNNPYQTDAM